MLDGRRILVTGASSGIGRGLLPVFAEHGARLLGVGRDAAALDLAAASAQPGAVATAVADLTTEAGRSAVITAVDHRFGGVLDVVVHAAGLLGPPGVPLADYPPEEWHRVMDVNVTAVHLLHQTLADALGRSPSPTVIGVSSTVGREGRGGWGAYSVSKFALEGWLATLADEFEGRVFSVNPGGTRTPMRASAVPAEDPMTLPTPADISPLFLRLSHAEVPEDNGSLFDARDWIGADPWGGITTGAHGSEIR